MDEHPVTAGVLDGADVEDLRAVGGELQHLLAADPVEFAGERHHAGVGGEDAVDVAVDLADIGLKGGGEGDGGRVGPAATERGDVAGVAVEPLEPGDDDDGALVERLAEAHGRHVDDACRTVRGVGDHARLAAGEGAGLEPHRVDRHGQEGHRDALAAGQQHVELARRGDRSDLAGEVEQFVGGVAHRTDRHDDLVSGATGVDDALGDALDALGVGDGRAAVLLDDQSHEENSRGVVRRDATTPALVPRPRIHLSCARIPAPPCGQPSGRRG